MTTARTALLFSSFAVLALAACSNNQPPEPTPPSIARTPPGQPAVARVIDTSASDVAPASLIKRPAGTVSMQIAQVTQAASPAEAISFDDGAPVMVSTTDAIKIVPKGTADLSQTIPVDSTAGEAYLFLGPQVEGTTAINDILKRVKVFDPDGAQVNVRAPKGGVTAEASLPMSAIQLDQRSAGLYTVRLDPTAAKAGIALDVRQPMSTLVMKMKPSVIEHLLGNAGTIDMYLDDGGLPVSGAITTATLLDPTLKPVRPLVFKDLGQGHYQADIGGDTFKSTDPIGAWLVDINAEGTTAKGLKFLRSGRVGFHFGIPTAKITDVGETRTLRNEKGEIEAFEVDVHVDCSSLDRLELSAQLATKGSDGLDHAAAVAFTGAGYDVGGHTLTLHFDAGYAKLTHLEGEYTIRNLKLFSIGTNTLFQRIGEVPSVHFSGVKTYDMASLKVYPAAVEQLIQDGVLFKE